MKLTHREWPPAILSYCENIANFPQPSCYTADMGSSDLVNVASRMWGRICQSYSESAHTVSFSTAMSKGNLHTFSEIER